MSTRMEGDGEPPDPDLEKASRATSPRPSMASQRRRPGLDIGPDLDGAPTSITTSTSTSASPSAPSPLQDAYPQLLEKPNLPNNRPELVTYESLPEWYKDNEYIVGSYRPESLSTSTCLRSLLYLHNETVNIYTHLIPAVIFLAAQAFMLRLLHERFPSARSGDFIVFSFFLLCAFLTLGLSALYHTLMNHSRNVSFLWLRMDYLGILVLILGALVSGIRMGFYCDPLLQKIYWSMTITLTILTSILVIHPKYFQGHRYRRLRVSAFLAMGLSSFIPVAHGFAIYGARRMWVASGLPYYLGEGGLIALGAVFYSTRYPESLRPGRFDLWGCSHSIFHVLVVAAAMVHFLGIWKSLEYNIGSLRCR